MDGIDADHFIELVNGMYGGKSGIVLGDDAIAQIREDRAMQMRQAQEQQMMQEAAGLAPGMAKAAKDMSETQPDAGILGGLGGLGEMGAMGGGEAM
jgi:hypothetical protein